MAKIFVQFCFDFYLDKKCWGKTILKKNLIKKLLDNKNLGLELQFYLKAAKTELNRFLFAKK